MRFTVGIAEAKHKWIHERFCHIGIQYGIVKIKRIEDYNVIPPQGGFIKGECIPVDRVIPTHVSNTDPVTIEDQAARQP